MEPPIRFILKGIPERSIGYTRYASVVMGMLKQEMSFQNLFQGVKRVFLQDGTSIVCQVIGSQRQITITTQALLGDEYSKKTQLGLKMSDVYILAMEWNSYVILFKYWPGTNRAEIESIIPKEGMENTSSRDRRDAGKFPYWSALHMMLTRHTADDLYWCGPQTTYAWTESGPPQPVTCDFLTASGPVKGWPNYVWIVCVGGGNLLSGSWLGWKQKSAIIMSLATREVVAWFKVKGVDNDNPDGYEDKYFTDFNVEYTSANTFLVKQYAEETLITTSMGPDESGNLTILEVTKESASNPLLDDKVIYDPYEGTFTYTDFEESVTEVHDMEGIIYGGLGHDEINIVSSDSVIGIDSSYHAESDWVSDAVPDTDIISFQATGSEQGEKGVINYFYAPLRVWRVEIQDTYTPSYIGLWDTAYGEGYGVISHWDSLTISADPAQMRTRLRASAKAGMELYIQNEERAAEHFSGVDDTSHLSPYRYPYNYTGSYIIGSTFGNNIVPGPPGGYPNPGNGYLPSISHAVGSQSSMLFTKDHNPDTGDDQIKIYFKAIIPKVVPDIELEDPAAIPEEDVDLRLTSARLKQQDISTLPWGDITEDVYDAVKKVAPGVDIHEPNSMAIFIYSNEDN